MSEPTWARRHTLQAGAGSAIDGAHGNALPVILQMVAETEAEAGR
jgi:hypothetical protein